ncbi:alpha/beta hydrolase family protein [mine drainage metagenome]|uniref:Alpha/beta hydrolase family protein n=1 Tax=mine drainage metagenome TaxID=410659 RepID=A0A1J5NZ91_9ZZZZ
MTLAVALRNRVTLASLAIIEAPAVALLLERKEVQHYRAFRQMTDIYFAAFKNGNAEAIEAMINFYGGAGTFASWPPRVRTYAVATTPVNILDWASAYSFPLSVKALARVQVPTLVILGGASHPAMQRTNELVSECMSKATLATIEGAAHFMIATHASEVARLLAQHVHRAERASGTRSGGTLSNHDKAGNVDCRISVTKQSSTGKRFQGLREPPSEYR